MSADGTTNAKKAKPDGDRPTYRDDDDQLGYRAVVLGPDVGVKEARVEPVNPAFQKEADLILWRMRQR